MCVYVTGSPVRGRTPPALPMPTWPPSRPRARASGRESTEEPRIRPWLCSSSGRLFPHGRSCDARGFSELGCPVPGGEPVASSGSTHLRDHRNVLGMAWCPSRGRVAWAEIWCSGGGSRVSQRALRPTSVKSPEAELWGPSCRREMAWGPFPAWEGGGGLLCGPFCSTHPAPSSFLASLCSRTCRHSFFSFGSESGVHTLSRVQSLDTLSSSAGTESPGAAGSWTEAALPSAIWVASWRPGLAPEVSPGSQAPASAHPCGHRSQAVYGQGGQPHFAAPWPCDGAIQASLSLTVRLWEWGDAPAL